MNVRYRTSTKDIYENYYTTSPKSKNLFYGKFMKHHIDDSSKYYKKLDDFNTIKNMIESVSIKTPHKLLCRFDREKRRYFIVRKIFN